ncbi:hypothetical protein BDY17DRAFT_41620 [Neohortaea acidophila]|uniref:Uncharacterized protein n=1 Tax=Neohortaea acidophila TaxID=245834 RepID=A0A6A6PHV6_9PEZI|nr:uncharacterized protein BDY17DRAFT_41620 [Neohortaea acidophila]KAF2479572.1 hypothetical protein BDY17DRAFT_41620 [Neohortaea acidophila]
MRTNMASNEPIAATGNIRNQYHRPTSSQGLQALPPHESSLSPRPEDKSALGQLLSWIPAAPSVHPTQMPPLSQPIIIPQIDVPPQGESVPFARCYTDALASHSIPMREFLAFLDGLAVAQSPNATLQGVRMFGAGASHVPIPFIPLAAKGLRALASTGSGHSGSRARLYLERAKSDYFAPRGLRVTVVKDSDLNFRLQVPPHAPRLAPLTKATVSNTLCERRLEGTAPYVSPLRYNVPPEDEQLAGVHRLARKHLQRQIKRDANLLADLRHEQWLDVSSAGPNQQEWDARYAAKMAELRHCQTSLAQGLGASGDSKEGAQQLAQLQRDVQILVSERQVMMQNLGRAVTAEMEEDNWSRRLKWIVIENLE